MEGSGWRPAQGDPGMASSDWRSELSVESRQRIVNKIMETLKKYLPISGPEGVSELNKIAVRFEEKIYTAATSQPDYLRKISLKMLTMESKSASTNPLTSNSASGSQNPQDPALHNVQQVRNQGQSLPISLPNQAQARQQILSQNVQNPVTSGTVQSTPSMSTALSSIPGMTQTSLANVVSQSSTLPSMSGISQNSLNNSMGQSVPQSMFTNAQRQIQARQHSQQVASQQLQQQPQNQQQIIYHQQLQQQMSKQKIQQQGSIQSSLLPQSHMQQHQPLLQPSQATLQQPQASVMQTAQQSGIQHGQQSSLPQSVQPVLQQHQQSVFRHQQLAQQSSVQQHPSVIHQQAQINQASMLPSQQQQQLINQTNSSSIQQNQILGQQNTMSDLQQQQQQLQQQQQQRMLSQQNLSNMQQQQQLLGQQGNIATMHQQSQQLGQQSSISGLQQQQQLLGPQSNISNPQQQSHPIHQLLQHSKPSVQHQQPQQASSVLLQQQAQQPQSQTLQQPLMSQLQPQPTQVQQQLALQQQSNSLQRELQKRIQTSSALLQQQVAVDQKPLFQPQRVLPDTSSTSVESSQMAHLATVDWQEEVYQKIKALKDMYFDELNDVYQKLTIKCQQQSALGQTQMQSEQIEKLRNYRNALKTILTYLAIPKNGISLSFKDKIGSFEKQILHILNLFKARRPASNQQGQQQLPQPPGGQSLSVQQQQTQPQISQLQQHESHTNQLQSVNLQNSVTSTQSSAVTTMQPGTMPLGQNIGIPSSQQNLRNVLQSGPHSDSTQANNLGSLQQSGMNSLSQGSAGSLQQNTVNTPQQSTLSSLPQSSINTLLQTNVNIQPTAAMLQHQQQLKQIQQRQTQQQHKQQMMQQMMQQPQLSQQYQQQQLQMHQKQQQSAQLQAHQMTQLHQLNDVNELKIKPGVGLKAGLLQPHHSIGQRAVFQQLKTGSSFPVSSPQILQSSSPQISQHSSPQVDQQSLLAVTSLPKVGTPMQAANSPFIVPSPSTPLAPSPLPGDTEKPGASPLSNTGNSVNQQSTALLAQAQSLAIGTPGLSPSPLLAEFSAQDGNHGGNAAALGSSSKSSTNERPLDRLIKAVSSVSSRAFTSSISDISSIMNLTDRMVGSAPGNGSRTVVGEDLVATTRCRIQARNLAAQDGNSAARKMKRNTTAMPLNAVSSAGSASNSIRPPTSLESSELESTATSRAKKPKTEVNQILLDEIKDINQKLIDTIIDISDEDSDLSAAAAGGRDGIVIKCSYNAVALSQNMKSQYALAQISPILPLKLLIPSNYPKCSPVLLDIPPVEVSEEGEDLSAKAKSRFNLSVRGLPQPMSLGDMARTWDVCARKVMEEYAQQTGGGSFSSRYGAWENCVSA